MLQGIYAAFHVGLHSWQKYSVIIADQQQARQALTAISTELRQASDIFIVRDPNGILVKFKRPLSGDVQYIWQTSGENAYKIIRRNYSRVWVMAGNITAFELTSPKINEAVVAVTSGKQTSFTLREKVVLRARTPMFRTFNE